MQRGARVPSTFRLTLGGTARALAPLAAPGQTPAAAAVARARASATGAPVGTVSLSVSPSRAVGLARLGRAAPLPRRRRATRPPGSSWRSRRRPSAAPASEGESIPLPVTGTSPLVRGAGDAFLPAGTVATHGGRRVRVPAPPGSSCATCRSCSPARGALQGLTGDGRRRRGGHSRRPARAARSPASPERWRRSPRGLGVPSVSLDSRERVHAHRPAAGLHAAPSGA